jgi:hypothetical protein
MCEKRHAFQGDNDLQIIISVSLKPWVIRQAYERKEHFSVAGIRALLDEEYRNPSIRDEIQKVGADSVEKEKKCWLIAKTI